MDTKTYIADMNKVKEWQEEGPNWHLEYSARQAYIPERNYPEHSPLTPAWWHNVTVLFEQSNRTFDKYMLHRTKSAPTPGGRWHAPGEPDDNDPDNGDDDEDELILPWSRNQTADEEAYMHLKRQIICQIRAGNSEMRCDYKHDDPNKQISATSLAIGREAEKRFCGLGSLFERR
jgi:sphingomyelin phosphodiesterase